MLRTRWCTSCRLYCCSPLLSCGLMLQCCCFIAQDYTCYWVLCPGFIAHHFLSNLDIYLFFIHVFRVDSWHELFKGEWVNGYDLVWFPPLFHKGPSSDSGIYSKVCILYVQFKWSHQDAFCVLAISEAWTFSHSVH